MTLSLRGLSFQERLEMMNKRHFDAWGHPILGYFEMLNYFANDSESLRVIRRLPSFRYVCLPTCHIVLEGREPLTMTIVNVWPGGHTRISRNVANTSLEALRRLYGRSEVTWRHYRAVSGVEFVHLGKVIPALWSNYCPVISAHGV